MTPELNATYNTDRFVTVDRYFHPFDAYIAAGLLRSEEIPVSLCDVDTVSMYWLIAIAIGGIRIQVPVDMAIRAREILGEDRSALIESDERCPMCDSNSSSAFTLGWKFSFLVFHILKLPISWDKRRCRCNDCSYEYSQGT